MTAEIAIINRSGIALAADSAVTINNRRVYKTSNKIFSLGPDHDIAIMIYGNSNFLGAPWEAIIKEFKRTHSDAKFETVSDCTNAFFNYLTYARSACRNEKRRSLLSLIVEMAETIADEVNKKESAANRRKAFYDICSAIIEGNSIQSDKVFYISRNSHKKYIESHCNDVLDSIFKDELSMTIVNKMRKSFAESVINTIESAHFLSKYMSGVVFSGYGKKQILPSLIHTFVDGHFLSYTRFWISTHKDLNKAERNNGSSQKSSIFSFAQNDVSSLFIEGVLPDLEKAFMQVHQAANRVLIDDLISTWVPQGQQAVERAIQRKAERKSAHHVRAEMERLKNDFQVRPTLDLVSTLPKEDMCKMAESMVGITSLKRKIESHVETVSGPIDVCFISKADGVIWIKRKNYFDLRYNSDYLERKFSRSSTVSGDDDV